MLLAASDDLSPVLFDDSWLALDAFRFLAGSDDDDAAATADGAMMMPTM
jgi:hypothetical protein